MPRRRVPGTIQRRGKAYRVRVQVDHQRRVFTVQTTDRRVAEAYAIQKEKELRAEAAQRAAAGVACVRMSTLLTKFEEMELAGLSERTQAAYRDSLRPFRRYFVDVKKDPTVESIQAKDVEDYLAWRRVNRNTVKAISAYTLRKDRAVLHRAFVKAERYKFRVGNPVAAADKPKADKRDPVILTEAQYDSLLDACGDRRLLRLFILTLGETGARSDSEVLRLTRENVHLDDGFIYISQRSGRRVKGGQARWIPMTPRLAAAMKDHFAQYRFAQYEGQPTPWVFHHDHNEARFQAGERVATMYNGFKAAAIRAKLPPELRPHDMRHRRITTWLPEGQAAVLVKEAVGHADLRTTMGYTHLSKEHLRALVARRPEPPAAPAARTGT